MTRTSQRSRRYVSQEFQSPEASENETSYDLAYSRSGAGNIDGPSTSRAAAAAASRLTRSYATKSTSRAPPVDNSTVTRSQSQNLNAEGSGRRKKTKPRKRKEDRNVVFLREVRRLQSSTVFMIPKLPFGRLVREIMHDMNTDVTRMTVTALEALQEATELYITQTLNDAFLLTQHTKRKTLFVSDIQMLRVLKLIT